MKPKTRQPFWVDHEEIYCKDVNGKLLCMTIPGHHQSPFGKALASGWLLEAINGVWFDKSQEAKPRVDIDYGNNKSHGALLRHMLKITGSDQTN